MQQGNQYCGQLECLKGFVNIDSVNDNWIVGSVVGQDDGYIRIKMYAEGSEYGIDNGRISKLFIRDSKGTILVNYDRGWDVKPRKKFYQLFVNRLVASVA